MGKLYNLFKVYGCAVRFFLLVVVMGVGGGAMAQVSITSLGTAVTENFDGMGAAGITTPTGWFVGSGLIATGTTVTAGTGNATGGGNYNFGVAGINVVGERALGSLASSNTARNTEARFTNNTGSVITSLVIKYDGEQWRLGQTASNETGLVLYYSTDGTNFTALGTSYNFIPPIVIGTANPLDGNASANRIINIGGTYTPASSIAAGATFYLRWVDIDNTGSDAASAIDNFSITASGTSITNFYWNGSTISGSGAAIGGNGTWNTALTNWISPTNDASGSFIAWTNSTDNVANFANGSGTVIMPVSITANKTVIGVTGYTFAPSASISLVSPVTLTQSLNVAPVTGTNFTMSGVLSSTGGLIQNDAGTTILSGNSSYSGTTTVSSGTLQLGATGTSPNSPLGTTAAGTTVSSGAVLDLNGNTLATAEGLTLNGTGSSNSGALVNSAGTAATYSGAINLQTNSSIGTTGNITASGVVSGTGSLTKVGSGILILSAANTYSGVSTTVNGGILRAGVANALPTATALSLANTAGVGFDLSSIFSQTIGSLSGGGIAGGNVTLGTGTLTVGNATSTTYAGVMSGTGKLTKTGAGALTLTGTNTYTGATTISGGTLYVNGSMATGSAISVAGGATFAGNGTAGGTVSLTGTVSPGGTSAVTANLNTGAFTFIANSIYTAEVSNVGGIAGTVSGWDKVTSTGAVNVTALPIIINVTGIAGNGFNNTTDYTWTIASGTSISGFNTANFTLSVSGFGAYTGTFSVKQSGNNINVVYTAIKAEPADQPSAFQCDPAYTATTSSLKVKWTDATGTPAPDGYLIKWVAAPLGYSDITNPTDGTAVADGAGVQNVAQSVGNFEFTGLAAGTAYYFKIWSYTNSGSSINYKTDGIIGTTSCMTQTGPCLSANFDASTTVPSGWSGSSANDIVSGHFQSSPNCRGLGTNADLITPSTNYPAAISFYVDASNGAGKILTLEYRIGAGAWTSISTFTATSLGATQNVPLTSSPNLSTTANVSFRFSSNTTTIYIDDVSVTCGTPICTAAPTITTQPADVTVAVPNTATFSVAATGGGISYQWQVSTDCGATWSTVGTNSLSYTTNATTIAMNGYHYRVVITSDCGTVTSDATLLTVLNSSLGLYTEITAAAPYGWVNEAYAVASWSQNINSQVWQGGSVNINPGQFKVQFNNNPAGYFQTPAVANPISVTINAENSSSDAGETGNTLTLYYSTDGSNFFVIGNKEIFNSYVDYTYDVSSLSALSTVYFKFGNQQGLHNIYIQKVTVIKTDPPSTPTVYTWASGAISTKWNDPCNWSPKGVPGALDDVIFTNNTGVSNSLSLTDSRTVNNFTLNGFGKINIASTGTLTINGTVTSDVTNTTTNFDCASTVNIKSAASQIVPPLTYGNLNVLGGDRVFPNGGTIGICSAFAVDQSLYTYTVTGSTVNYSSPAAGWVMTPFTYYNLKFSGTGSFSLGGFLTTATDKTVNVLNDFSQTNGTVYLGQTSNKTATLNVAGNATFTGGIFDMNNLSGGTGIFNLKGDLAVGASGTLQSTIITNNAFNFNGTYNSLIPATIQTIDNAAVPTVNASPQNAGINFNVKAGTYAQLINQNFKLGSGSKVIVEGGAIFDFNFDAVNGTGPNALNITGNGLTGTGFTTAAGGYLKISSPQGVSGTSGSVGNIQINTTPVYTQPITYHYIGKAAQFTGTGIEAAAPNGLAVIVDLATNTLTLTPSVAFGLTNATNINVNSNKGGVLDIRKGQFTETASEYITGSTGTLYMAGGTLYQVAKGNSIEPSSITDPIPRMDGVSFPYIFTGGTIELAGSGVNAFQTLRSNNSVGRPNYIYIKYSGTNTLGTNYKNLTNQTTLDSALIITGNAIVDCIGAGPVYSAQSFIGNGGIIMDGGRLRLKNSSSPQPELDAVKLPYNLTGGVIEFYASNIGRQSIRGKATADIIYKNIEITGSNVGNGANTIFLNSTAGKLTVKNGGNLFMSNIAINSTASPNTSSVIVETGGTFSTGSDLGFSGSPTSTTPSHNSSINANIPGAQITLSAGSTVDYYRTGDQLISNEIPYQNFTISGSGIKTAPSTTLTIQGNLTKTGTATYTHNNGTVLFSGNTPQSYGVNNTMALPIMTFYNVTNSNNTVGAGLIINDSIAVVNQLSLDGAITNLNVGDIILKSSVAMTAGLLPMNSGSISYTANADPVAPAVAPGRFVIERYINNAGHAKAWQFLATPILPASTQTINQAFQEGGSLNNNPKAGFGIQLTNSLGTGAGYDGVTAGTSIKTYISASNQWDSGPSSTTTKSIYNQRGWMTFVRGDRTITSPILGVTNSTILRTRGKINVGNQGPFTVNANVYESVGNPYASAIDLTQTIRTNLANEIYVWDPTLGTGGGGGNYGVGRYRVLTLAGSNYHVTPSGGAYPNAVNNTIQSGQAFFIKGTAAGAGISFSENSKVGSSALVNGIPVANPAAMLTVNLSAKVPGSPDELLDGGIAIFDKGYADEVDDQDGTKLVNSGENIGFRRDKVLLTVERRSLPKPTDTLNLEISGFKQQGYMFDFNADAFNLPGVTPLLWDKYSKTYNPISGASTIVNFSVDANAASAAADRFKIVFASTAAGPLPVTLTKITANRNADKTISVHWQTANEINLQQYSIERSGNSSSFDAVGKQAPLNNTGGGSDYTFNDIDPLGTDNYYRIKALGKDGSVQYSPVVKVAALKPAASISVYPNPVVNREMNLRFVNQAAGRYELQLMNKLGQVVYSGKLNVVAAVDQQKINLGNTVAAGTYQLFITAEDGKVTTLQVIVNNE